MQLKDEKRFLSLNTDDHPSQMGEGDVSDALNVRMGSSSEQHGVGIAESLQSEISVLINPDASIIYYGLAIGGSFQYSGYQEVTIGSQTWMKKNWDGEYPGSKAYDNDEANADIYGRLYTWEQIMSADFCPEGWHVPTEAEWDILLTYLGGLAVAGGKMKEPDDLHWTLPNTGADDSSGFKALPGGKLDDVFSLIGEAGLFWIADGGVPVQPTALAATEVTFESFVANWQSLEGADGYYLDIATDAAFTAFVAGYNNKDVGAALNENVTGLNDETDYYYRIRAYNEEGTSVNSNTITVATLEDVLPHLLDKSGNVYNSIIIGNQEWIIENYRTLLYADGTPIKNLTENGDINLLTGWTNISFNTFTPVGPDVINALNPAGPLGYARANLVALFNGEFLYYTIDLTLISGDLPLLALYKNNSVIGTASLQAGINNSGFLITEDNNYTIGFVAPVTGTRFSATCTFTSTYNRGWANDTEGAYCWYDNDIANKALYGALYNWFAVNNAHGISYLERGGVEELGWRMPTTEDYQELSNFLGGDAVSGAKLKEIGDIHWNDAGGTNTSGFTALPGGNRDQLGTFSLLYSQAAFWHSDEFDSSMAWWMSIPSDNPALQMELASKNYGFSIRLVRNVAETGNTLPANDTTNITVGNKITDLSIIINYVATRGALYQQGEIILLSRGTSVDVSHSFDLDDIGMTATGSISGNNIKVNLIVDNSSVDDVEFYYIKETVTL